MQPVPPGEPFGEPFGEPSGELLSSGACVVDTPPPQLHVQEGVAPELSQESLAQSE